jgi:pimeloyl-ACP methyl ester carboxylesterase
MKVEPFVVHVPQSTLDDLKDRLARTRWPDEIEGSGWDYGANLAYLKELVDYWRFRFDWCAQEKLLNSFPHFRAEIDGLNVHFIHQRGRGPKPLPLIITHGWPSTFFEMYKIIPMLADPAAHGGDPSDAFDVVAPSLPGYGFSDAPRRSGWTSVNTANLWAKLMTDVLGYKRFAAHGGDVGAGVTSRLGLLYPDRVIGIHVTAVVPPYLGPGSAPLTDAEKVFIEVQHQWEREEDGYGHIQGTRPQTLAYGLNDSPVGLAAWIVEKFRAWSECGGDVERCFTKDELLTNVTIYWATQTINSSIRHYYESRHNPQPFTVGVRVTVPCGVCLTTEEVDRAPREWAERTYNVQRFTRMPRGGHFAALESPNILMDDIRTFFRPLR